MHRQSQHGIAVITVLLALAIAVLVCSEVIARVYASMKRSENYLNTQQAWEYALGGEALAREILAQDFEKDQLSSAMVDNLHEKWAQPLPKINVTGGSIEVEVYDAQSRFNLNNLVSEDGEIQPEQVGILQRLMAYLGVRSNYAELAARWASYDNDTEAMYDSDKANYRAADTQFGSISELRLLKDFHTEEYRSLAPFVSVLPVPVRININTAPAQVLLALTDGTEQSAGLVQNFVAQRQQQEMGYTSPDVFANMMDSSGDGDGSDGDADDVLAVNSEYFEVRVIADYGKSKVWLVSTVFRDGQTGEIHLLSRDTSQRFSLGIRDEKKDKEDKNSSSFGSDSDAGSDDNDDSFIGG